MPRLDQLDLDQPGPGADRFDRLRGIIEWMRECGRFEWADATLTGIYDSVSERGFVTEGQWKAVSNIWDAKIKDREFGDLED